MYDSGVDGLPFWGAGVIWLWCSVSSSVGMVLGWWKVGGIDGTNSGRVLHS